MSIPRMNLVVISAAVLTLFIAAGCSETNIEVVDPVVDVDTDDTLPDGFVTGDRPDNPPTSFEMPCPWREVVDPADNPYFIASLGADMIPTIDEPQFASIRNAGALLNFEQVIVCEFEDQIRAFPVRILLHHEIVNLCWDTPEGPRFSYLTYCPLVDAAIHFVHPYECDKPRRQAFGTSGGLLNGNLITFDRGTGARGGGEGPPDLFVQLYAGGVFGTCTTVEPQLTSMSWALFQRLYPEGEVMTGETGADAPEKGYSYYDHPYWQYWRSGDIWFPLDVSDTRGVNKMVGVFGVITPGGVRGYITSGSDYVVNDVLGTDRVVVWNDAAFASTAAFEPVAAGDTLTFSFLGREAHGLPLYVDEETGSFWTFDGIAVDGPLKGERLPKAIGIRAFWFIWAALYPEISLYRPGADS